MEEQARGCSELDVAVEMEKMNLDVSGAGDAGVNGALIWGVRES